MVISVGVLSPINTGQWTREKDTSDTQRRVSPAHTIRSHSRICGTLVSAWTDPLNKPSDKQTVQRAPSHIEAQTPQVYSDTMSHLQQFVSLREHVESPKISYLMAAV